MIKHCVFIQFRPEISQPERQALYQALAGLQAHLNGWLGFAAGANDTPEQGMDKGYDGGFIIDFADEAALNAYQQHPLHQQLSQQLVAAAQQGVQGIMVFDMHLP